MATFQEYDESQFQGRPVLLFDFLVSGVHYRYTNVAPSVSFESNLYVADDMKCEGVEIETSPGKQELAIETRRDHPIALLFQVTIPVAPIGVTIYQAQADDLTVFEVFWTGRVQGLAYHGSIPKLVCDVGGRRLQVLTGANTFGSPCNWTVGYPGCPVDLASHTTTGTLSAATSTVLRAPEWVGFAAGYFVPGVVKVIATGEHREVVAYDPSTGDLTLKAPILGLNVGDSVDATAGCDGSYTTCSTTFAADTNSGEAHGGFRFVPTKDPYKTGVA